MAKKTGSVVEPVFDEQVRPKWKSKIITAAFYSIDGFFKTGIPIPFRFGIWLNP